MNPPAIDLRNVAFRRDSRWILRDLNWTVPARSCAAILGPNGSGKSTLARILAGHLWPSQGEVFVLGQHFGDTDLAELRRSIRLLQPAGPYDVVPDLAAREVVLTGFFGTLALYKTPSAEMITETDRLLTQLGLQHVADHPYYTLSSGERVRSLIARALVVKPRLLLLDEPTAGLDILAREQILAAIQSLFDEPDPPTIVLITHHVEELPPATSSVLLLCDGRDAAQGNPQQVLTPPNLSRAYGCPVQVRRSNGRFYLEVNPTAWNTLMHRPPTTGN